MKKLLVAILALTTASAFAGNSMIRLDGCFDGTCDTLDFDMYSDDVKDSETKTQNLALNYAMSFAGNWGAGLTFAQESKTTDGDISSSNQENNHQAITISGYYNMDGAWDDSCFVGLHYTMDTVEDHDTTDDSGWKDTTIGLEFGHRYKLGSLVGVNWNWAPSVSYNMTTRAFNNDDADDVKATNLTLNVANVAVTF